MDDRFAGMYCAPGKNQYWDAQEIGPETIVEPATASEARSSRVDVAPWWSSLTPSLDSGHSELSSSHWASLDASGFVQEAGIALLPSVSPISSDISGLYTSMQPYTSSGEPCYASSMASSPGKLESGRAFDVNDAPYRASPEAVDLPCFSPVTLGSSQQAVEPVPWQTKTPRNRAKHAGALAKRPTIPPGQASASKDEVPIVCQVCQQTFLHKSSLDRHWKEVCGSGSARGRFCCDPNFHFGCKRSFKRRCGLKGHYKKLNLDEEQADAKIREQYEKGMHRRLI